MKTRKDIQADERIIVTQKDGLYYADMSWTRDNQVIWALFGTYRIPLPFTTVVPLAFVLRNTANNYPGIPVMYGGEHN